jgi:hypothetical protein
MKMTLYDFKFGNSQSLVYQLPNIILIDLQTSEHQNERKYQ